MKIFVDSKGKLNKTQSKNRDCSYQNTLIINGN